MLDQRKERFGIGILLCEPPSAKFFVRIETEHLAVPMLQPIFQTVADFLFEFVGAWVEYPVAANDPLLAYDIEMVAVLFVSQYR
ncbi:MAG: hypothetical protein ACLR8Y_10470 [Alistipes indistinctus]